MRRKTIILEIVIVIVVFIVLLLVSIPRFFDAQFLSKVARAKERLEKVDQAMRLFIEDHGRTPRPKGMMTNPDVFFELLRGKYLEKSDVIDPFLGPNDVTNDGDPSSLFFTQPRSHLEKFLCYNQTTSQYRGVLPGKFVYDFGSCGPDKIINLDNAPSVNFTPPPVNKSEGKTTVRSSTQEIIDYFSKFDIFIDYDPSNGLISDGDIHVLGP